MTVAARLTLGLAVAACSSVASAAVYTSAAGFNAHVAAGAYANDFSAVPNGNAAERDFAGNGYAYQVTATTNLVYAQGGALSTSAGSASLVVSFTGAPVTAIGGNFFATDDAFAATSALVTISLSDGTSEEFASTSAADFRGFTSDVAISSLTFAAGFGNDDFFPTLDNLTVGTAVAPEPTSLALLALGVTSLAARRRTTAR